jgi:hypothetical protein
VWEELLRNISLVGEEELVWAGGASVCDRSLDAWSDIIAAYGGVCAFLVGPSGALVVVATVGGRS